MTSTALIVSRGKMLSKALRMRKRGPQCSEAALVFRRHFSSLQQSVLEEEEDDQEWTATPKSITASLPLISSTATSPPSSQHQQHKDDSITTTETEQSLHVSPSELLYTGDHKIPITSKLHIVTPSDDTPRGIWPVFRLMDEDGHFRDPAMDGYNDLSVAEQESSPRMPLFTKTPPAKQHTSDDDDDLLTLRTRLQQKYPHFHDEFQQCTLLQSALHDYPDTSSKNTLLRAYTQMIRLREMDIILQNAQRQGRISFYMTCRGEEAIHIGSASALTREDTVLAQYREAGLLMWRGFTLDQFTNQCFSNNLDLGKGRQMPVHYGSRALNYHTISSPLGTQLPQAVGVAYHAKLSSSPSVTACFFGDGCASTTDFHSACNFAATLKVPVLFICRNNGYAISTSVKDQYAGDGIVSRAPGYGMAGIRVDGNDVFAVHAAIAASKKYALEHSAPVLVELMTYRLGHHSTSDDSTRYRSLKEVHAHEHVGDPVKRLGAFLQNEDIVDESWMLSLRDTEKMAVLKAMEQAERRPKPPLEEMFQDVYCEVPPHLQRQEEELHEHIAKYPEHYQQ